MALGSAAIPRGVWSLEANAKRQENLDDVTVAKAVLMLPRARVFRRDLLAYCTLHNLIPHPQLLPLHPDEEERRGAASSELSTSSDIYDVREIDQISIKHWQLDDGNCRAMCFALPLSEKIRSICLLNVGLNKEQLQLLCSTIPKTRVTALQLEWNHSDTNVFDTVELSGSAIDGTISNLRSMASPSGEKELSERKKHDISIAQEEQADFATDMSEVFALLLSEESALVFLSLRANGITSRGAVALAQALRHNKTLEALNLFQNSIGDAGAQALAHALPFNTSLKTLSLANNHLSGRGAKLLVDGLTKYAAPAELLAHIEAAEDQIHALMDQAKKARKKVDRTAILVQLGLPVLESVNGVQYATGNATLEELILSGNAHLGPPDVETLSEALNSFQPKLKSHLRCVKLQRLPKFRMAKSQEQQFSEFIVL